MKVRAFIVSLALSAVCAGAQEVEVTGLVSGEVRAYPEESAFPGQHGTWNTSLVLQPEIYTAWNDSSFLFTPYLRVDQEDSERTHVDIRELIIRHSGDWWELKYGIGKVFWGVTESIHLVDVINQTDLVDDPDGEDKLGQPMVHASFFPAWGNVDLFVMPYFRERTFPGRSGRLRPGPLVAVDDAEYESSAEEHHVDSAVHWSQVLGDFDVGVSHFYGTSREPELRPRPISEQAIELVPYYQTIHQTGLDLQYTRDGILLKGEAIYRDQEYAAAGGFEYTFVGLFDSDLDLGWLVEYLYDERGNAAFEDDVFTGFRLTLNDVQSTELLAGVVQDVDDDTRFVNVEASRRIGDRYKLSFQARWFTDVASDDPLYSSRDDDYLQFELARYF